MEKKCSKCQAGFNCRNEVPGCWCEDIHLKPETLAQLKNDFANCLCPECLKEIEKEQFIQQYPK